MLPADANRSFSRHHRIQSSLQIQEIVAGKQSVFVFPIKCYYRLVSSCTSSTAIAVVVPKRRFHRAVDRNRLKRLMREAYRIHKGLFAVSENQTLQMCWVYVGNEVSDFTTVCHAVERMPEKLSLQG